MYIHIKINVSLLCTVMFFTVTGKEVYLSSGIYQRVVFWSVSWNTWVGIMCTKILFSSDGLEYDTFGGF